MDAILIYLLKVAAIQLLLAMLYNYLFRNDTFYTAARWYFITGIAISFILPLLNYNNLVKPSAQGESGMLALQQYLQNISAVPQLPWWQTYSVSTLIIVLWSVIALCLLWRVSKQFIKLGRISYNNAARHNKFTLKYINLPVRPFSFGRSIYINSDLHTEQQLDEIIRHESIHIQQFHTFDIVLSVLNKCLFWWNPASWYIAKAVRNNLEYIVDEQMLQQGINRKQYQYHLLQISQLAYSNSFTNNFNLFNLKTRIKMMNKEKTSPIYIVKWALLIPVAILLTVFIGTKTSFADDKKDTKKESKSTISIRGVKSKDAKQPHVIVDGKESNMEAISEIDPDNIDRIEVIKDKDATDKYGDKAKGGVILITLKNGENKDKKTKGTIKKVTVSKGIDVADFNSDENVMITIDGEKSTAEDLKKLNPDVIVDINVVKESDAATVTITTKK